MTLTLVGAWVVAVFLVLRMARGARRADEQAAAMAARKQAAEIIDRALRDPWPGVARLDQVREEFPELDEHLVYSVACARARLARQRHA